MVFSKLFFLCLRADNISKILENPSWSTSGSSRAMWGQLCGRTRATMSVRDNQMIPKRLAWEPPMNLNLIKNIRTWLGVFQNPPLCIFDALDNLNKQMKWLNDCCWLEGSAAWAKPLNYNVHFSRNKFPKWILPQTLQSERSMETHTNTYTYAYTYTLQIHIPCMGPGRAAGMGADGRAAGPGPM